MSDQKPEKKLTEEELKKAAGGRLERRDVPNDGAGSGIGDGVGGPTDPPTVNPPSVG